MISGTLLIVSMQITGSSQEQPQVFSAVDQFSLTQNPNGVWSYGFTDGLGGPFTLYTINGTAGPSGTAFQGWYGPFDGFPLVQTNAGIQYINCILLHPTAPQFYSIVRWTAPTSGRYDLLGLFVGLDSATTDVHVLRTNQSLFNGQIKARSDTAIFDLQFAVEKGEMIDFAVGVGIDGSFDFDSTGLKATITGPLQNE